MFLRLSAVCLLAILPALAAAQEPKVVCDFEADSDLALWDFSNGTPSLSDQHATHGKKSLKLTPGMGLSSMKLPQDWTGNDSLQIDIFVEGEAPAKVMLLVGDKAWEGKRTYWNRHNSEMVLKPGANTYEIPVNGLFRGEAGSRNGDLKNNIDPKSIILVAINFESKAPVYLDNVRFTKEARPDGILAYDFGPDSQKVFPGFTAIGPNTVYGENGAKAGLKVKCSPNRGRDDNYPTRLFEDFVWFQENGNEFITDAPNGKCHVWLVFDDPGFWGGEQAHFRKRTVTANGKQVSVEDRGDDGPTDCFLRFENLEPKPGDSLWDLYVKPVFKPIKFDVDVTDGKIHIQCEADAGWSSKVASIIVYPDTIKADGEKWIDEVLERNKKEFEGRALFMGPKPKPLDVPADAKAKGYWVGYPVLEDEVTFADAPGKPDGKLQRSAFRGQSLGFSFAVRPLKDFGDAQLSVGELKGPGGTIPAANVEARYVMQLTRRAGSDLSYVIAPTSLRRVEGSGLKLGKDLTRQFWITVNVPADAKPGLYSADVTLTAGELKLTLPLKLELLDIALDEPDFAFGFFGVWVPGEFTGARHEKGWDEILTLFHQMGMNSLSGGPNIHFSGLDAAGNAQLDFTACDAFFKRLKAHGFTSPIYTYGGPGVVDGLHDGYTIGATGHGWEQKTGKPFKEILKAVFTAYKAHAEKEGWPQINYSLLDEPRVLEAAKENLELHQAYHDAVPFWRTGGFYSVEWQAKDPLQVSIQDIFKAMFWSGLNAHTQEDLNKAKELGREVHIYNQGQSRYSFGAYQWAELRKGVKGRLQWHTLNLAGYQFMDLDGQEPDSGVINWGRKEIIPTIQLAHCGEGAWDFRIAVTLWNAAQKKKDSAEGKAAIEFLEKVNKDIPAGKNTPPGGFMDGETFRSTCIDLLRKVTGK